MGAYRGTIGPEPSTSRSMRRSGGVPAEACRSANRAGARVHYDLRAQRASEEMGGRALPDPRLRTSKRPLRRAFKGACAMSGVRRSSGQGSVVGGRRAVERLSRGQSHDVLVKLENAGLTKDVAARVINGDERIARSVIAVAAGAHWWYQRVVEWWRLVEVEMRRASPQAKVALDTPPWHHASLGEQVEHMVRGWGAVLRPVGEVRPRVPGAPSSVPPGVRRGQRRYHQPRGHTTQHAGGRCSPELRGSVSRTTELGERARVRLLVLDQDGAPWIWAWRCVLERPALVR